MSAAAAQPVPAAWPHLRPLPRLQAAGAPRRRGLFRVSSGSGILHAVNPIPSPRSQSARLPPGSPRWRSAAPLPWTEPALSGTGSCGRWAACASGGGSEQQACCYHRSSFVAYEHPRRSSAHSKPGRATSGLPPRPRYRRTHLAIGRWRPEGPGGLSRRRQVPPPPPPPADRLVRQVDLPLPELSLAPVPLVASLVWVVFEGRRSTILAKRSTVPWSATRRAR